MKKIVLTSILAFPFAAFADHLDVIQMKLAEDCSVEQYVAIMRDFNEQWAKDYGYEAELAVPLQGENLDPLYWVGRSADAATFGAAWDAWRDAQSDPSSLAARLQARFAACGETNLTRHSYDTYK